MSWLVVSRLTSLRTMLLGEAVALNKCALFLVLTQPACFFPRYGSVFNEPARRAPGLAASGAQAFLQSCSSVWTRPVPAGALQRGAEVEVTDVGLESKIYPNPRFRGRRGGDAVWQFTCSERYVGFVTAPQGWRGATRCRCALPVLVLHVLCF